MNIAKLQTKYLRIKILNQTMGTRSGDQQKKQRQKEFKEKKEHQERLLAAKKANHNTGKSDDEANEMPKTKV
ncbi:MAG: hypothetical protein COW65_06065 [Cytophagales bacterium CG18_big_fil_WC_8_21_14_2_50_42_9]|nr:MAG: hypothetical protein COW65_06065 [Cytophagales bacterium CG18_big_fil_WC_8_21_14_2_50_42_9]